jgi:HEAT repeat protein
VNFMKNGQDDKNEEFNDEYKWNWKMEYIDVPTDKIINELLNAGDFEKQYKAAYVLNKKRLLKNLKNTYNVEQLVKRLDFSENELIGDESENENLVTIWTLGKIKDKKAVKSLKRLLKNKPSDVMSAAAWALGEIGDKSAIPALKKAVEESEPQIEMDWTGGIPAAEMMIEEFGLEVKDAPAFVTIFNQISHDTFNCYPITKALKKLEKLQS